MTHSELTGSDLITRGMAGDGEVITDTGLPPLQLLLGSLARLPKQPPGKFATSLRSVRSSFSIATILSWRASGSCCKRDTKPCVGGWRQGCYLMTFTGTFLDKKEIMCKKSETSISSENYLLHGYSNCAPWQQTPTHAWEHRVRGVVYLKYICTHTHF